MHNRIDVQLVWNNILQGYLLFVFWNKIFYFHIIQITNFIFVVFKTAFQLIYYSAFHSYILDPVVFSPNSTHYSDHYLHCCCFYLNILADIFFSLPLFYVASSGLLMLSNSLYKLASSSLLFSSYYIIFMSWRWFLVV